MSDIYWHRVKMRSTRLALDFFELNQLGSYLAAPDDSAEMYAQEGDDATSNNPQLHVYGV